MADIKQFFEAPVEVTVQHGEFVLKLDCLLNRVSAEDTEYNALVVRRRAASAQLQEAEIVIGMFFVDGWMTTQIAALVPDGEESRLPTSDEVKSRTKKLRKQLEDAEAQKVLSRDALIVAKCLAIIYLTKSWDATEGDSPYPLTVESLRKFPVVFIDRILGEIEGAVLGPFAGTPNSTTT